MRRRVKEQLKKLDGMEFYDVNFSYIDLYDMSEHYVSVPEQGGSKLIPDGMCNPGQVYTVSRGKSYDREYNSCKFLKDSRNQDFRARTPEKGIAAMDGGAIPVRPALKTLRRMPGTSCVPEPEHRDGPAA